MATKLRNGEWDMSAGGILDTAYADEETGDLIIHRMQNVSPILDHNAFLRSLGSDYYKGENGEMWHFAKVPPIIMEELCTKLGADVVFGEDPDGLLIKTIERDYPYLKVGEFNLA